MRALSPQEVFTLTKRAALAWRSGAAPAPRLAFTIPIFEPLPPQYFIKARLGEGKKTGFCPKNGQKMVRFIWSENLESDAALYKRTSTSPNFIKAVSDSWLGAEAEIAASFRGLVLPQAR